MSKANFENELFSILKGLQVGEKAPGPHEDPTEMVETVDVDREIARVAKPVASGTVTARNCFHHPDAHPLVLDLLLLRRYGPEFLSWDAEALEHVIPQDFRVSSVSHVNMAKIQACRTLHLVDSPWERWEVFGWVAMSLNGVPPDFELMQVPTVAQAMVAADIFNRIRTDVSWSEELRQYLATIFRHDEMYFPMPPLQFVDLPVPDAIDPMKVNTQWPSVRGSKQPPQGETVEDEQLRRMLTSYLYMVDFQDRLRAQLEILHNA